MIIYTSYYAKVHHLPKGYLPISISRITPHWVSVKAVFSELAPSKFLHGLPELDYIPKYKAQLDNRDADLIAWELYNTCMVESETDPPTPVLLCYEKPESFCHRHLAAEWLRAHGYDCTELALSEEHAARYDDHIPTTLIDHHTTH